MTITFELSAGFAPKKRPGTRAITNSEQYSFLEIKRNTCLTFLLIILEMMGRLQNFTKQSVLSGPKQIHKRNTNQVIVVNGPFSFFIVVVEISLVVDNNSEPRGT